MITRPQLWNEEFIKARKGELLPDLTEEEMQKAKTTT